VPFTISFSVSNITLHGENDSPCEKEAGYPVNSVMKNFHAKVTNLIAKVTNLKAKAMNSIAKVTNSISKICIKRFAINLPSQLFLGCHL